MNLTDGALLLGSAILAKRDEQWASERPEQATRETEGQLGWKNGAGLEGMGYGCLSGGHRRLLHGYDLEEGPPLQ